MAGKIRVTPCPQCSKIGGLNIVIKFVAKSLPGKWSLAGAQAKVPARQLPVLECDSCDLSIVGKFDGDGASFNPNGEINGSPDTTDAPASTGPCVSPA